MSELTIALSGIVGSDITWPKIADQIREAEKDSGKITDLFLEINSPGGDYFEGISIYNKLSDFDGKVRVDVIGEASSAANVIAMAASPGELSIRENAKMLAHFPFTGRRGNADDFQKLADELKQLNRDTLNIYVKRTKMRKAELEEFLRQEKLMSAKEAVEKGFADRIEKPKDTKVKDYSQEYSEKYISVAAFSEKMTIDKMMAARDDGIFNGRRLATVLNSLIDDQDGEREQILERMAQAAGISVSTVNQILRAEINCPPLQRLRGFARVLGTTLGRLRSAAESDGCEYGEEGIAACEIISKKFTTKAWNGSKSRFTIEQLLRAVPNVVARWARQKAKDEDRDVIKTDLKLPYREPDGTININGVRNALARLSQTDLPSDVKDDAGTELRNALEEFRKRNDFDEHNKMEVVYTYRGKQNVFLFTEKEAAMLDVILKEIGADDPEKAIEEIQKLKAGQNGEPEPVQNRSPQNLPVSPEVQNLIQQQNQTIEQFKVQLGEKDKTINNMLGQLTDATSFVKNMRREKRRSALEGLVGTYMSAAQLKLLEAEEPSIYEIPDGVFDARVEWIKAGGEVHKQLTQLKGSDVTDETSEGDASAKFLAAVKRVIEENPNMNFRDATMQVRNENSELAKAYDEQVYMR